MPVGPLVQQEYLSVFYHNFSPLIYHLLDLRLGEDFGAAGTSFVVGAGRLHFEWEAGNGRELRIVK